MNRWIRLREGRVPDWLKPKISCQEETDGGKRLPTQRRHKTTSGKSSVSTVMERDISLAIVPRNSDDPASNVSGNRVLAPAVTVKQKSKVTTNKYARSAMTALQNREPRTGFPTLPTNRTMSKNSLCNRCWEPKDRIFKELEPDGLGKSYSL